MSTVRVCHVTSAHTRYDSRILIKECISLSKAGYEVYLIVNDGFADEIYQGVHIISTGFVPKNRIQRFLKARRKIRSLSKDIDADIYHVHDPDLLPLLIHLAKKKKITIFDSHEDIPNQVMSKVWIPKLLRLLISRLYSQYEQYVAKNISAVISVDPFIVKRFRDYNPNSFLVTNFPIIDDYVELERARLRSIGFAGGVTSQYNHGNIIRAISTIPDISYIIAGNLSAQYRGTLSGLPGWNKVVYHGQIPPWKVNEIIYDKISIGVCIHSSYQVEQMGGSLGGIKLFEIMERGIPVICSNYPLWSEIVDKNRCGISVDPSNIEEIRGAIEKLLSDKELASDMGSNGRKAVENEFNWGTQEEVLLSVYKLMILSD